jgi:hypothetical protein
MNIENYRSLQKQIVIRFPKNNPVVLPGANYCDKSNIITAIDLIFSKYHPKSKEIEDHDFYKVDYLPENDRVRYTIHPDARREVLKRLLELNHIIHEEEVKAGLWDKKSSSKKTSKKYKNSNSKSSSANEPEEGYGDLFDT